MVCQGSLGVRGRGAPAIISPKPIGTYGRMGLGNYAPQRAGPLACNRYECGLWCCLACHGNQTFPWRARMFEHAISPTSASRQSRSLMHRRSLLIGAGAAGMVLGTAMGRAYTQIATAPDHSLRIAPLRLELAPGKVIDTFGYNGTVPGLVFQLCGGH